MSIALPRLGIEDAATLLRQMGFTAIEVFLGQIGPAVVSVLPTEAHATATAEHMSSIGLTVSTLNVVGDSSFDPHGDRASAKRTSEALALHMRIANELGAPRVLIWEGRIAEDASVDGAIRVLSDVIARAQELSHLPAPPTVSVELHPYTFALKHGCTEALARALQDVGAGLCVDFCHFGVASGPDATRWLTPAAWDAVNHVHFADTDCRTPDFHYPPGQGTLMFAGISNLLLDRRIAVAWDLFGWPAPRHAMAHYFDQYKAFVRGLTSDSRAR